MEPIKNALAQAGSLVQQAAQTVADVFKGGDTEEKPTTDTVTTDKDKQNDDEDKKTEKNIDSKQKQFEQQQSVTLQKSEITAPVGVYEDKTQSSDAKVLPTSWPDLKGKSRHTAEEIIKSKGYANIKVLKKGTSSTTEHDESRVILFVDDDDIVVEEPKVG